MQLRRTGVLLLTLLISTFALLPPQESTAVPRSCDSAESDPCGEGACRQDGGTPAEDAGCCPGGCTECSAPCCLGLVADLTPPLELTSLCAAPLPSMELPADLASTDLAHPDPPPRS